MFQLKIELKRVQTFIFEVPRLRAMLGANALIGQTMRHELTALLRQEGKGLRLNWPPELVHRYANDPLNGTEDPDDPAALYADGILARDGGHFIAVFASEPEAEAFRRSAEALLAERLPGVLYEASIEPFPRRENHQHQVIVPRETALLDLPVLQVCQETGTAPASNENNKGRWQAYSVTCREEAGREFYDGKTKEIIGLLRRALYPDQKQNWTEPNDLAQLVAGGYLALIHADGNDIGKRYKKHCDKKPEACNDPEVAKEAHGEAFFHSMRVAVRCALVDALAQTFTMSGGVRPYEVLMLGGDDLLLVCRADRALDFAYRYAEELKKYPLADGQHLDVAIGVAIAQESYPLHRLQELADGLAASAKRLYRALDDPDKTSVIDWQVVTQSWFEGIAEARRQSERITYTVNGQTETLLLTSRPYRVTGEHSLEKLVNAARKLDGSDKDKDKAARSPLRSLRGACERGRLMGEKTFAGLPPDVQTELGWEQDKLWKSLTINDWRVYATRALDIIGIREIANLGRKKP
ncbi:MAG: hypothetical protein LM550_10780 [Candidatus Contendobacter sp.]|jgi:hypothetical protein|nr:hypothetical protein [Candidatus Contendobacter sp.]